MYAYGANKRAPRPLRYRLTSLSGAPLSRPDGQPAVCRVLEKLSRMNGFERWALERHEGHFLSALAGERDAGKLVYLSSEADEALEVRIYMYISRWRY